MAWFDWLTNKKTAPAAKAASTDLLTSTQLDNTRPMIGKPAGGAQQPAALNTAQRLEQKRNERNAKRELLFQVVREAMVRVGVLSSAFKFKVLSLDQRGRSFLVMVELSAEFSGEVEKLAEIEAMIANAAKTRYEIIVQAVYWRYFNVSQQHSGAVPLSTSPAASPVAATQAVQQPVARAHPPLSPAASAPAPLLGAQHAPVARPAAAVAPAKNVPDALEEDEVAAFRRALAAGATAGAGAALAAAAVKPAPVQPVASSSSSAALDAARNKLLLTGYEDTEMADDDPMPALSGTQYGELR
jgi:hypothetical protein